MLSRMPPLAALLLFLIIFEADCVCPNPQKNVFLSLRALANKDDLEKMFQKIGGQLISHQVDYKDPITLTSYTIFTIKTPLLYNRHYQTEKMQKGLVVDVNMGPLSFDLSYRFIVNMTNSSIVQGQGYAIVHFDQSKFSKEVINEDGFVEWKLTEFNALTLTSLFVIEKEQPPNTDADRQIFSKMLNGFLGADSLKDKLVAEVNVHYQKELANFLNAEKVMSTSTLIYNYKSINISLTNSPSLMELSTDGLLVSFRFGVDNVSNEYCPTVPKTTSQFGGIQEIVTIASLEFYVQEAFKQGLGNLIVDAKWQVNTFQMFMGDLGNSIAYANQFQSDTPFVGQCKTIGLPLVSHFSKNQTYTQLTESCEFKRQGKSMFTIDMKIIFIVQLIAEIDTITTRVSRVQLRSYNFKSIDAGFKVTNDLILRYSIEEVLKGLVGQKTFGNGFPVLRRLYPAITLYDSHMALFDGSQLY